jgi:1-acyl-sn-glycerol-3-phosphate acyltransferase
LPAAGGFVLAANHNSNFDPWPLGIPLFPKRFLRFMAKSELFWTPFKQFATAAGAFPVRRGQADAEAMAVATQLCREGHIVVIFPVPGGHDGRRDCGRSTRPARTPVARIALDAHVPLVGPGSSAPTGSAGSAAPCRVWPPILLTTSPVVRMRRRLRPSA